MHGEPDARASSAERDQPGRMASRRRKPPTSPDAWRAGGASLRPARTHGEQEAQASDQPRRRNADVAALLLFIVFPTVSPAIFLAVFLKCSNFIFAELG